jgi:hypothetical protein
VSGATTPEQGVLTSELRHAVSTEIRSLAPKLRDALLLAQSGEYTYEELGAMLHAPVGTIKWRVSEARRRIKTPDEPNKIGEYLRISEGKLNQLPKETYLELRDKGVTAVMHAHLLSLGLWPKILSRAARIQAATPLR